MDAAKAAAVFAENPGLTEKDFYDKKWDKALPVILIGTTSGTGSEVTDVAVLTDSTGKKHSIHDEKLFAKYSFGDPRYTLTVPGNITLSAGIDVLAHCLESYFSKKSDDISKSFSIMGISLLFPSLRRAASGNILNIEERESLYNASILGGLAISVTGTCFPHNVGYYLTEKYNIPHGAACAVFLPDLLSYVKITASELASQFFKELNISEEDLLSLISDCVSMYKIFMTDDEIDFILPRWKDNNSVKNTIGNVSVSDIESILRNKFLRE